jgi:hypothetical protein
MMKQLCAISLVSVFVSVCSSQAPQAPAPAKAPPAAADKPAAPEKPAAPAPPAKPPPTPGDLVLEAAWQAAKRKPHFAAAFREQVYAPGVNPRLEGRYILQPENKVVYEAHLTLADSGAEMKIVLDGENYWFTQTAGTAHRAQTVKFRELMRAIDQLSKDELGADKIDQLREDAHLEFGLAGFEPLFRDLRDRLTINRVEHSVWKAGGQSQEHPVYLLEGTWNRSFYDQLVPTPKPGESRGPTPQDLWSGRRVGVNVARTCKLYLARDGAWPFPSSFWPYRIEWYGPAEVGGRDVLLSALEFERIAPETTFALSPEERKDAATIDPSAWVKNRKEMILQEKKLEEDRSQRRIFEGR